jgi:sulfide:quinone oxidoreductase
MLLKGRRIYGDHGRGNGVPGVFEGHGECFIEIGQGKAGIGMGNFYAEPLPTIEIRKPRRI